MEYAHDVTYKDENAWSVREDPRKEAMYEIRG